MKNLIIVMGVSGSGKTSVGESLARALGIEFVDGDDLHLPENVRRMSSGIKLDDESRQPWLASICECAESHFAAGRSVVIACSALKAKYRTQLRTVSRPVVFVFLNGPQQLIAERINRRAGHYMPVALLNSQFTELEEPQDEPGVIEIEIDQSLAEMTGEAIQKVQERLKMDTSK